MTLASEVGETLFGGGGPLYGGWPYWFFEHMFVEEHVEGGLTEIETYCLRALLTNDDREGAKSRLRDWGKLREKAPKTRKTETASQKTCEICKFVPGTHHYVLGTKFDTLDQAKEHAAKKGYAVTRVFEVDGSGANRVSLLEVMRKRGDDE